MHKSCLASRKCYCVSSGYHQLPGVGSEEGCGPVSLGLSKVSLSGLETNQKLELLLSDRALDYYVWDPTFDLYTEKKSAGILNSDLWAWGTFWKGSHSGQTSGIRRPIALIAEMITFIYRDPHECINLLAIRHPLVIAEKICGGDDVREKRRKRSFFLGYYRK